MHEKTVTTEHGLSHKSGIAKILLTPKISLPMVSYPIVRLNCEINIKIVNVSDRPDNRQWLIKET